MVMMCSFQMCLPWLFFDGKLFHANLARVSKARNVLDLCGGRIDIMHQARNFIQLVLGHLLRLYSDMYKRLLCVYLIFGKRHLNFLGVIWPKDSLVLG